jgi:hypothetical protein
LQAQHSGQQRYWDGSAWTEHTTAPTVPAYQAAVQQAPRDGLGLAAFVLGVIGLILAFIPLGFLVAGILGIIGLILGFLGRGRAKRGEATNGTTALWASSSARSPWSYRSSPRRVCSRT